MHCWFKLMASNLKAVNFTSLFPQLIFPKLAWAMKYVVNLPADSLATQCIQIANIPAASTEAFRLQKMIYLDFSLFVLS